MTDRLNDIFDVDPELVTPVASNTSLIDAKSASIDAKSASNTSLVVTGEIVTTDTEKLDADFEAARTNISQMTKDVTEAAKSAILLAQSGDSPRAYEVVATMLTAIVNANKELVQLHATKQKAKPQTTDESQTHGNITIDKAVFIGRSSDLLRELKKIQKGEDTK